MEKPPFFLYSSAAFSFLFRHIEKEEKICYNIIEI